MDWLWGARKESSVTPTSKIEFPEMRKAAESSLGGLGSLVGTSEV